MTWMFEMNLVKVTKAGADYVEADNGWRLGIPRFAFEQMDRPEIIAISIEETGSADALLRNKNTRKRLKNLSQSQLGSREQR